MTIDERVDHLSDKIDDYSRTLSNSCNLEVKDVHERVNGVLVKLASGFVTVLLLGIAMLAWVNIEFNSRDTIISMIHNDIAEINTQVALTKQNNSTLDKSLLELKDSIRELSIEVKKINERPRCTNSIINGE